MLHIHRSGRMCIPAVQVTHPIDVVQGIGNASVFSFADDVDRWCDVLGSQVVYLAQLLAVA